MPTYESFPTNVPGPSFPIDKQAEPKIKKVEFGDGYTQEGPDGLNHNLYTWSLTWDALTPSEKETIEDFLVARGGYQTFVWTDPDDIEYRVKARSWTFSEFTPRVFKLTTTFKQVVI